MSHYLGIDWSDKKHDLCLLNQEGRILSQFTITHDMKGFQVLAATLKTLNDVQINLERSDGLLVDWLSSQGWPVYVTPPIVLAHRRPRRSKDDRGDAYLLAHLLRMQDLECRPLILHSEIVHHLKQLAQAYDGVLQEQRRLSNRLTYLLKQYYPTAVRAFSMPNKLIALTFLERYPTPEAAEATTVKELHDFLKAQHYPGNAERKSVQLYAHLHTPMPTSRMQAGLVEHVQVLIPLLRSLYHSRSGLDKRMLQVFDSHPEADWWRQFPGAGPLTAARLLAWIGDNRDRFPSAQVLQAIAGTAPITRRSGKQHSVEFRSACCHPLRKAMDDLARESLPKSGWAQAYFQEQLAAHRKPARAYRALANRWLAIIWKLWKTGEQYDEAIHLANRSRRGREPVGEQQIA